MGFASKMRPPLQAGSALNGLKRLLFNVVTALAAVNSTSFTTWKRADTWVRPYGVKDRLVKSETSAPSAALGRHLPGKRGRL